MYTSTFRIYVDVGAKVDCLQLNDQLLLLFCTDYYIIRPHSIGKQSDEVGCSLFQCAEMEPVLPKEQILLYIYFAKFL